MYNKKKVYFQNKLPINRIFFRKFDVNKMLIFIIILLTLACYNSAQTERLDEDVISWSFGSPIRPKNSSVEFGLKIFSPTKPGKYHTAVFLSGLDGIAPGSLYVDFSTKLVKENSLILIIFEIIKPPKLPDKEEKIFAKSIEWTLINLENLFNSKETPALIKNRVFPINEDVCLMGHSASGHTVVSYLNETCGSITSLVLFDPVDGYDPFGFIKKFITHPPDQLPFAIPTLIIRSEFDPIPKSTVLPACAPDSLSNERFYNSLHGPTWMLNFTHYGHGDFLDNFAVKYIVSTICKICKSDCDFDMYRTNVVRAITLFYKGVMEKNKSFLLGLENPNNSSFFDKNIRILSTHKYNGYDVMKTGSFCNHS